MIRNLLFPSLLILSQGATAQETDPYYAPSETNDLAFEVLSDAQVISFRRNRELCGYIGITPGGDLRATEPTIGKSDECFADDPPLDWILVASYHTHGAYSPDAFTETPSPSDIVADRDEGVSGFVSTPGGRFWFVDGAEETAELICAGCLPADPLFEELDEIEDFYTLDELEAQQINQL